MKNNLKYQYHFKKMPFYWHPLSKSQGNEFPETLPFTLYFDETLCLLRQRTGAKVNKYLTLAYQSGSHIIGLMDAQGIGNKYASDFLRFISQSVGKGNERQKELLEIGSGTGYLLKRMADKGYQVTGYEPGFDKIGKYPVPVIRAFFPSKDIVGRKFDVIMGYGLLEHLKDPQGFLKTVKRYLHPKGILIIAVPDCEEQIKRGDVSMLLHEHYSYFTAASLHNLLKSVGFQAHTLRKAYFGGSIYVAASIEVKKIGGWKSSTMGEIKYFSRVEDSLEILRKYFNQLKHQTISVYVPIRALSALYLLKEDIQRNRINLRFADDSPNLQGKYLPGFNIKIESINELIANPPDAVLVYSYTFDSSIALKLKTKLPGNVRIATLREIFNDR